MLGAIAVQGQAPPGQSPAAQRPPFGNLRPANDTLPPATLGAPPSARSSNIDSITISKDALEDQIDYSSADSMYFDIKNKQIHLYGQAQVKYQEMNITANYILIDWKESTMFAEGKRLTNGEWLGKPKFTQAGQEFTVSSMKYNYKSNKGIIYDGQTKQEGLNIIGEKGKFFGAGNDTTKHNVIYNRNAIFTTCDLDHPHFGIRSNKQKIVQDKVAVVGPCNLVVGDIPTPLWLPFGFFPLKLGVRTGLIFPQNYQYSEAWGFGLDGVGYYLPINDNMDLQLLSDIYLKGTVRLHAISSYKKRYKYGGNVRLDFAYQRSEDSEGLISYTPSGALQWSHTQDAKAHPYRSLNGSINIQVGNYQRSNLTSADARLNSSLNSNMSLRQRFDKPFDLSASFNHSQNTNTRNVSISFPTVNFQTQNLYPFKRKVNTGGERWYERIQMRYTGEAKNQFTAKDSTLFQQSTLDSAKFGMRHNVTTSTSFNLLKYFNFNPSIGYKEVWYFKTSNKTFDPTPTVSIDTVWNDDSTDFIVNMDTTKYGTINTDEMWQFKPLRQFNAGASMSTKIFGTLLFKRGKLRGLRHVITPTVGFNYTPDYTNPDWGYFKTVKRDLRNDELLRYSIWENNRSVGYDQPSTGGKQMAINYGFSNLFEAKIFQKRDSTLKNIKLFNGITVNGNYNLAADSLKWSTISIGGNTGFFNNLIGYRFNVVLDPYDFNRKTGSRINTFNYETNGRLLHLTSWNMSLNTNITVERLRDFIQGKDTDKKPVASRPNTDDEDGTQPSLSNVQGPEDFLSLFENFSIRHDFTIGQRYYTSIGKDSVAITTHTISSRGTIKLTPNWNINVGNFGYDFQSKKITYPDFSFSRDLHCWEMGLAWQPRFGSYSFFIHVKPGKLDFINIPYRKGIQDSPGFRGF